MGAIFARQRAPRKGATTMVDRQPICPSRNGEFAEVMDITCLHCEMGREPLSCSILCGMLDHCAGEGPWPDGGWVTDPGAVSTCLSYVARKDRDKLSRQQVRRLGRMNPATLPPVCGGCAARKGSEASCALHTRRDFEQAVQDPSVFLCHERPGYCGGWVRALLAKRGMRVVE
jgi:hypothetical protein